MTRNGYCRANERNEKQFHFRESDDNKRFNTPRLAAESGSRALPWGLIPLISLSETVFGNSFEVSMK
jgi:hypothetical protein